MRYAREEPRRQMLTAPRRQLALSRLPSGEFARVFSIAFVNSRVYTNAGLDRRQVRRGGAGRLTGFLTEIGLPRGPGRALWRGSGLLA